IFPWLQTALTALSNQLSMAFLDALIVFAALWLIGLTVGAFLLRHRLGWFAAAGRWIVNVAASAAVVYLAFLVTWGLNYRRVPITGKLPYDRSRVTPDAAHALALRAVDQVNSLYASAHATLART